VPAGLIPRHKLETTDIQFTTWRCWTSEAMEHL